LWYGSEYSGFGWVFHRYLRKWHAWRCLSILYMSIRSFWSIAFSKISLSLLISSYLLYQLLRKKCWSLNLHLGNWFHFYKFLLHVFETFLLVHIHLSLSCLLGRFRFYDVSLYSGIRAVKFAMFNIIWPLLPFFD
jgi:hypothetical protein